MVDYITFNLQQPCLFMYLHCKYLTTKHRQWSLPSPTPPQPPSGTGSTWWGPSRRSRTSVTRGCPSGAAEGTAGNPRTPSQTASPCPAEAGSATTRLLGIWHNVVWRRLVTLCHFHLYIYCCIYPFALDV